ncbi:AKR1E2 isoform 6, partial [Pan troglodytes]
DVSVTAYRPLGGSCEGVDLIDNPVIQRIAKEHDFDPISNPEERDSDPRIYHPKSH